MFALLDISVPVLKGKGFESADRVQIGEVMFALLDILVLQGKGVESADRVQETATRIRDTRGETTYSEIIQAIR
jgi:hypothetical protein